jgi:hypothetical protein
MSENEKERERGRKREVECGSVCERKTLERK